jgi:hypothetical protein
MAVDEQVILRAELRRIVGKDYLHVEAKDNLRHFDPITAATLYAGTLLLAYITTAATKMAETLGEKTATELWRRISTLLSRANPPATDDAQQLEQIKAADEALKILGMNFLTITSSNSSKPENAVLNSGCSRITFPRQRRNGSLLSSQG